MSAGVGMFGSIRVQGLMQCIHKIELWAKEQELWFDIRDLYPNSHESVKTYSFDFPEKEAFFLFHLRWQNEIVGTRIIR